MSSENREALEWLTEAESDFDDARYLISGERYESAAFLLHQASEKALKALQIEMNGDYDYSHDLIELATDELRTEFLDLFKKLNPIYTATISGYCWRN